MSSYEKGVQEVIERMERLTTLVGYSLNGVIILIMLGLIAQHVIERYVRKLEEEDRVVSNIVTKNKRALMVSIVCLGIVGLYINQEGQKGRSEIIKFSEKMEQVHVGNIQAYKGYDLAQKEIRDKHPEIQGELEKLRRLGDEEFKRYIETLPIKVTRNIRVDTYEKGIYTLKEEGKLTRVDLGGRKHTKDLAKYAVQYRMLDKDMYGYGYKGEKYIVGFELKMKGGK